MSVKWNEMKIKGNEFENETNSIIRKIEKESREERKGKKEKEIS